MLVSSTSMKAAMATTTAISHGLNFGRQGSAGRESAASLAPESSGRELERPSASFATFVAPGWWLMFFALLGYEFSAAEQQELRQERAIFSRRSIYVVADPEKRATTERGPAK